MAKISLAMKDPETALSNFNRSLAKQPNEESFIELSRLMIKNGAYEEAIEELNKALKYKYK